MRWNLPFGSSGLRKLEPPMSCTSSLQLIPALAEMPEGQCWLMRSPEPTATLPGDGKLLPCQDIHRSVSGTLGTRLAPQKLLWGEKWHQEGSGGLWEPGHVSFLSCWDRPEGDSWLLPSALRLLYFGPSGSPCLSFLTCSRSATTMFQRRPIPLYLSSVCYSGPTQRGWVG